VTQLPQQLGRYQILGRLGAGAMGEVYLAEDPQIDRKLAIKTVRVAGADGSEIAERRNRLLREAKAAGRLVHPNVVTLFDAGEEGGVVFLVFEYVEGVDLRDRLRQQPPLEMRELLRIGRQVASALAAAHHSSIIHRDVKPGNILLTKGGDAKIGDFGIAKMRDQVSDLTASGAVVGTPHYMSPEQIRGERLDGRSDLFSLGAILFEALHGARPFDGETITTVVFQILHHDPLSAIRKDLPPGLVHILERLLSKAKEDRFENGNEAATAIESLERALPPEILEAPVVGVTLPSLETSPTRVSLAQPAETAVTRSAGPPPPPAPPPAGGLAASVPVAAATGAPSPPPSPPRSSAAPPPPSVSPSAVAAGGAATHRRIHPGAIALLGCLGLLLVGSVVGIAFAWPHVRGWIDGVAGLTPEIPPTVVAERSKSSESSEPSEPFPDVTRPTVLPQPSTMETPDGELDTPADSEAAELSPSDRSEAEPPAQPAVLTQPRAEPARPTATSTTATVSRPAETPQASPSSAPARTTPTTTPRRDPPAPRREPERTTPAPTPAPAEPERAPPAVEAEPTPVAPAISFDSRLRTGRRVALHVEPQDVYVLVRGPNDQRFTLVGQTGEFDTRRRRARPLELGDGGTQYLMLRRDGYADHVVQLEVDDSIRGETPLVLRLGAGRRR
jgi:serine/threonine protein kinase